MFFLLNSRYAALITRAVGDPPWLLISVAPLPLESRLTGELTPLQWENSLRLAPFAGYNVGVSLLSILDAPHVITDISAEDIDNLRLSFAMPERDTGDPTITSFPAVHGTYVINRSTGAVQSYVISRARTKWSGGTTYKGAKTYVTKNSRLLVETETQSVLPEENHLQFELLVEYKWHDATLPEADFTLTAFGLPEPFGIEWEKPIPWWLYLSGGGLGIIVLLAVVYRLRKAGWLGQAAV
jgi:hypothetical protein